MRSSRPSLCVALLVLVPVYTALPTNDSMSAFTTVHRLPQWKWSLKEILTGDSGLTRNRQQEAVKPALHPPTAKREADQPDLHSHISSTTTQIQSRRTKSALSWMHKRVRPMYLFSYPLLHVLPGRKRYPGRQPISYPILHVVPGYQRMLRKWRVD